MQIETYGLSKRFGGRLAVDNIDLLIPPASITGFLGPNGAGKTTVIRMICGLLLPSKGKIVFRGSRNPPSLGVVLDSPAFFPWLTGRQNLEELATMAGISGRADIDERLSRVELIDRADDPAGSYSTGMLKRLAIAFATLDSPEILLLDEPFEGLDPESRFLLRNIISDFAKTGASVFISSHQLRELEDLCKNLCFIHKGRLLEQGATDSLLQAQSNVIIKAEPIDKAVSVLRDKGFATSTLDNNAAISSALKHSDIPLAVSSLVQEKIKVYSVTERGPGLEDLYRSLSYRAAKFKSTQNPRTVEKRLGAGPLKTRGEFTSLLRFEFLKLTGRLRFQILFFLPALLVILFTIFAPPAGLFLSEYQTKYIIPALTGVYMLTLSFSRYLYPLLTALVVGQLFGSEASSGTLPTSLLANIGRTRLFLAKTAAGALYVTLSIWILPMLYILDMRIVHFFISPAWWKAFNHPEWTIVVKFTLLLLPFTLCQLFLVSYWTLFFARARSFVSGFIPGIIPLALLAILSVISPSLVLLLNLPRDPGPALFSTQYALSGDFDLLHGIFNHGIISWPPGFGRAMLLLTMQGAACLFMANTLFVTRDFPAGHG